MGHFWLSEAQFGRLEPLLPRDTRGVERVDDRRVISGIVRALGCQRCVGKGFRRSCREWRATSRIDDRCYPFESPSHRSQPAKKGDVPRRIGRTKGGLNSKLHAVCDGHGRPLVLLLSGGQMSDYKGAALMLDALPRAKALLGDRGYDASG